MDQLVIIDYGMGNIESVKNALQFLGANCMVADHPQKIKQAKGLILPGVGAFHAAMMNLTNMHLHDCLTEMVVDKKVPFLGICLGMQLIAQDSTEQKFSQGLNWINGHVTRIEPSKDYRVPHVGWNEVVHTENSILFNKIEKNAHFYFDHSYHLECDETLVSSTCHYGTKRIASVEVGNIFAVQFHPEKSQRNGLRILRNFLNYVS